MDKNIFIIRIPEENEVYSFKVKSAEISISKINDAIEFGINVFAEESEFEEGNFAQPYASLGSVILPYNKYSEIEHIFEKGIDFAEGYDEEGAYSPYDFYLTNLYFLEHLILNNNKIKLSDLKKNAVLVHWIGTSSENQENEDDNLLIEITAEAKIYYDKEFIRPY
jgi:hypothetical protein